MVEHGQNVFLSREIKDVKKYIDEHFPNAINIRFLAELVFVSSTKLKKDFRKAYGKTLYEYLIHKRMAMAKSLLRESGADISTIAARCGYKTHTAFTVAFKKHCNMLPKEYRLSAKQETTHN